MPMDHYGHIYLNLWYPDQLIVGTLVEVYPYRIRQSQVESRCAD